MQSLKGNNQIFKARYICQKVGRNKNWPVKFWHLFHKKEEKIFFGTKASC